MSTPVVVCGAAGRMGRTLLRLVMQHPELHLHAAIEEKGHPSVGDDAGRVAGLDRLGVTIGDEYVASITAETVTLDFSTAPASVEHLRAATQRGAAIVIGTTGYSDSEQREIDRLAPHTRCVVAPNMSVGVNVLLRLVAAAATALGEDFDAEIVELHHRMKVDAPSGTALALGRSVAEALGRDFQTSVQAARQGVIGQRPRHEIGIMALRGGDIVGDHTVVFAGMGERLELTHRAHSRECLARGAIRAAAWVVSQPVGHYSMTDVLGLTPSTSNE